MASKQQGPVLLSEARKNKDRRADIIGALYRCMGNTGFAASTLNDIAHEAGMSSSHLLYYFDGKEAILEAFFQSVIDHVESQLAELPEDDPLAKIEAIAAMFLPPKVGRKSDRAVMLDLYGQAVQNKAMRKAKIAHDKRIKAVLRAMFEQTPLTQGTSADDAAQSAYAMTMGLRATSFYDKDFGPEQAHRLFRLTLFRLAGLEAPSAAQQGSA